MNPFGLTGVVVTTILATKGGKTPENDPIISTKMVIGVIIAILIFVGVLLGLHHYFPFKG